MQTQSDGRPLDDRTEERPRLIREERLARLSLEMVTPWQLPQITPASDAIGQVTPSEIDYVVAWQLGPTRP